MKRHIYIKPIIEKFWVEEETALAVSIPQPDFNDAKEARGFVDDDSNYGNPIFDYVPDKQ